MIETGTLLLMGLFALLAIQSAALRIAVVHLAVFSLLGAFLYLLYGAPELAIAEAAIGSGLVTLLYLAALQRIRVYTIALVSDPAHRYPRDDHIRRVERSRALREIRAFFLRREYEIQTVFVSIPLEQALADETYDLVMTEDAEGLAAYTDDQSYAMLELEMMFQMHGTDSSIRFIRYGEGGSA